MKRKQLFKLLFAGLLAGSLALAGCSGDDGAVGPAGPQGAEGPAGTPGIGAQANETCTVCHAEDRIADVADFHGLNDVIANFDITALTLADNGSGFPQLSFSVEDDAGNPVTNLTFTSFRFYLAELVPGVGVGDADAWLQWAAERSGTTGGTFVNNLDGSYTYTFKTAFSAAPDAANVQRLAARISGVTGFNNRNFFHDFLIAAPNTAVASGRDIVKIESCNECHDPLAFHGGGYVDTKMCVLCHNPNYVPDSAAPTVTMADHGFDFTTMVHQIHAGIPGVEVDWSEVTYPQSVLNCNKCHSGPDGANWNTVPTMVACGSCHADLDFATHKGGQTDNGACASCHTVAAIQQVHVTENATENNPSVPSGAVNFTYEISEVTVNASNQPVITFRLLADGSPVTFTGAGSTANSAPAGAVLTGFSGSPSFLMAYALPQDGIVAPADFNNLGNAAAQPVSLSIAYLLAAGNDRGTIAGPDASGYYTATITAPAYGFPAGATLRTVGLQGYFTQIGVLPDGPDTDTNPDNLARHTQSVVKAVTGDAARRTVVKSFGCAECHEIFEGHGGNRVLTADGGVEICTLCHVPNLTSSGRSNAPSEVSAGVAALIGSDPLQFPEATNNFKDMIHGIHSAMSTVRTETYDFVRNFRDSANYYDWSEVTYPGTLNNCTKCHYGDDELVIGKDSRGRNIYLPATFRPENVPAGALMTTDVTTNGATPQTQADVVAARASVPNPTDQVISPLAATCYSCHTATAVVDHTILNGAAFGEREDAVGE